MKNTILSKGVKERAQSYRNESKPYDYINPRGMEFFRPKEGKNIISIIPFEAPEGHLDYILDTFVHSHEGKRVLCPKKNHDDACPVCDNSENKAKRRALYYIIDHMEPGNKVQLWDVSHFLFQKELEESMEIEDAYHLIDDGGFTVKFKVVHRQMGILNYQEYKKIYLIKKKVPLHTSIIKPMLDHIVFPTPKDFVEMLYSMPTDTRNYSTEITKMTEARMSAGERLRAARNDVTSLSPTERLKAAGYHLTQPKEDAYYECRGCGKEHKYIENNPPCGYCGI